MICYLQPRNIQVYTDNKAFSIIKIHASVFSQYIWSAEDQTGMALDLNNIATPAERHSSKLEVRSGVLQPGQSYTFNLNASQADRGQWGSASVTIVPNTPPHGGLCDLSPESDIHLLETVVTYNCSGNTVAFIKPLQSPVCASIFGWRKGSKFSGLCFTNISCLETGWKVDESSASQLIYTFQVAPCHPNATMCNLLTLYR